MARRPESEEDVYSQSELNELRNNLARLSGASVKDFYRDAYRECSVERKPGAKAVQRLITAWKILRKWDGDKARHLIDPV